MLYIIEEEIAADKIGYVISNSEALAKITGEQRNVLQRFIDRLESLFARKSGYLDRLSSLVRIKNRSTQNRATTSPIKADDEMNASTNHYTQKSGNVNNNVKNSRDLSEDISEREEKIPTFRTMI